MFDFEDDMPRTRSVSGKFRGAVVELADRDYLTTACLTAD
jgi:hypothetical protein